MPARKPKHENREAWLAAAIVELRPELERVGAPLPKRVAVSCGFPSRSATSNSRRRIGECWHKSASDGQTPQTFITPLIDDPVEVLGILVHELVHAAGLMGHKADFAKPARALGLEGKMTSTSIGDELRKSLKALARKLGPYPHKAIKVSSLDKPQSTRMLKVECMECECVIRMTRKWLDTAGAPSCGCGSEMHES
jgi:hypothetical protein